MTVFLSQPPQRNGKPADISDLARFGDVAILAEKTTYPDTAAAEAVRLAEAAAFLLSDFEPSTDYLCLVGDPLAIATLVIYAMAKAVRTQSRNLQLLKWDRQGNAYYTVKIWVPAIRKGELP